MESAEHNARLLEYLPLVRVLADRLAFRLPAHIDRGDLYSAGVLGLMNAVEKFKPDRGGGNFIGYATLRIRGAMLDEVRRLDPSPRDAHAGGRWRVRRRGSALRWVRAFPVVLISFDVEPDRADGAVSLYELLADASESPREEIEARDMRERVARAVQNLPERERRAIVLTYFEGLSANDAGALMGVSGARVGQLRLGAIALLRRLLREPQAVAA